MTPRPLRALVLDPDPRAFADVVATLAPKGFHVAARLAPDDSLDYVRRTRPNVVLLGRPYWEDGWMARIQAASPGTVVVPSPAPTAGAA